MAGHLYWIFIAIAVILPAGSAKQRGDLEIPEYDYIAFTEIQTQQEQDRPPISGLKIKSPPMNDEQNLSVKSNDTDTSGSKRKGKGLKKMAAAEKLAKDEPILTFQSKDELIVDSLMKKSSKDTFIQESTPATDIQALETTVTSPRVEVGKEVPEEDLTGTGIEVPEEGWTGPGKESESKLGEAIDAQSHSIPRTTKTETVLPINSQSDIPLPSWAISRVSTESAMEDRAARGRMLMPMNDKHTMTYIIAGCVAAGVAVVGGIAIAFGVMAAKGKLAGAPGFTPVSTTV